MISLVLLALIVGLLRASLIPWVRPEPTTLPDEPSALQDGVTAQDRHAVGQTGRVRVHVTDLRQLGPLRQQAALPAPGVRLPGWARSSSVKTGQGRQA